MKTNKQKLLIKTAILLLATILFCLFTTTGCKNSYSKLFSYSVPYIPKNLDPQTACNSDEISIINSVFEGLYKQNPDKTYSLAAASNVESNNNKTQFLFSIKPDRVWFLNSENTTEKKAFEQPVAAADFEFAFKRLLSPSTNSPFAQNYYFIKNAQAVNEGKLNINQLGVRANNNNQLFIELEHPVPNLEEMLSLTPTMPCCEKFFINTKGRYGLNINSIMCCGKFYVHQWPQNQKDKKLRLRLNPKHPESKSVKILGVNLSQRPQQQALKLIKKNELDSAFFDTTETDIGNIGLNNSIQFQNSTCGIIFNYNSELFQNEKIRQALALTINRNQIKNNLNPKKATIAQNIIPSSVTILGKSFQNLKSQEPTCPNFDPEKAKQLFNEGINELKPKVKPGKNKNKNKQSNEKTNSFNLNKFSILISENQYAIVNEILQNWQQNLNLYLKTEICDNETYLKHLNNQNFDCTLITLENEFNSPSCILSKFLPNSPFNIANVNLPKLKSLLNAASQATTLASLIENYEQAEQEILNSASFIPILHPIKSFIYNKNFKNINLNGSCKQLLFNYISPRQ